jgi:hypothetical protein
MKLPRVFCALGLVISLAALAPAQEKLTDRDSGAKDGVVPRLVIDEVVHDFGEVKPGMPLQWTFKIKNAGTADLLIHSLKPG